MRLIKRLQLVRWLRESDIPDIHLPISIAANLQD